MNNTTCGQSDEEICICCYSTDDSETNPLLVIEDEDECIEFIHMRCARTNHQFGFCWCCGPTKVFYKEDLNDAFECAAHDGESNLDYPAEDAESFIENIQNNE